MASTARAAWSWLGAATPTKSPSLTTTTRSIASALLVSTETKVASKEDGRSTFPYNMSGSLTSEAKRCRPVTKARPSTFAAERAGNGPMPRGGNERGIADRLRERLALRELTERNRAILCWI